jgi:CRP/FNR family transcriptional regulator
MPAADDPTREALRGARLLAGLDAAALDALLPATRSRRYRSGEAIFHAEDPGDALFVVADGAVRIVVPSADGAGEAILAVVGPGEAFGELAVLDGAPRSTDAVAAAPTRLVAVGREALLRLVDEDPDFRRALLVSIAAELRRVTEQLADQRFLDLPGRLARHLSRAATGRPPDPDGAIRVERGVSQADLAAMVGGSRQSVNRALGDLAARGLVRVERDAIAVLDPAGLARAAER